MTNKENQNYDNCSLQELRERAKANGVQNYKQKTRPELLTELGSNQK